MARFRPADLLCKGSRRTGPRSRCRPGCTRSGRKGENPGIQRRNGHTCGLRNPADTYTDLHWHLACAAHTSSFPLTAKVIRGKQPKHQSHLAKRLLGRRRETRPLSDHNRTRRTATRNREKPKGGRAGGRAGFSSRFSAGDSFRVRRLVTCSGLKYRSAHVWQLIPAVFCPHWLQTPPPRRTPWTSTLNRRSATVWL